VSTVVSGELARPDWLELLPPGRRFAALPSRHRPLVVAELQPAVLAYVCDVLLTVPPGAKLPSWAYAAAGSALRNRGLLRLLPGTAVAGSVVGGTAEHVGPVGGLAGFVADGGRHLLVLQHGRDPESRWVLLLFAPGARWPSHAVKIGGPGIDREAQRLVTLERTGTVDGTLPRLVDVLDHRGRRALVSTALPGESMLVRYHRRGHTADPEAVRADFAAAARWLRLAQSNTSAPAEPLDLAADTLARLAARLADEPSGPLVLDQLDALRGRLRRHRVRRSLVHGDFWPGNLLVDGGEISGVVDWEHSEPAGNPVRDLARFALTYSSYLDRHTRPGRPVPGHPELVVGRPGGGALYGLDGAGWYPGLVREFLGAGLARLELPLSCGRDMVLAEIAALAAEATDPDFADEQLAMFRVLSEMVT
jgi:hypothetical protein